MAKKQKEGMIYYSTRNMPVAIRDEVNRVALEMNINAENALVVLLSLGLKLYKERRKKI
ncbi:MAG: hypothetical protein MIO92_14265 [Methanosarcinaceae archaeon]|nr:hypothetical protein [Methanosarcinaceae archaeon]